MFFNNFDKYPCHIYLGAPPPSPGVIFTDLVADQESIHLFKAVVDAVLTIQQENQPIDLHMVEIMEMMHKTETDTM